ncbi:MAG: hypothetical protein IJR45_03870, partial [Firmicutes bacterium]|nr:hypothetical protein [Bacillota bacterium]
MKKKTVIFIAAAMMVSSAISVQAADNMRDAVLANGYEVEVNTVSHEIFAKNYAKKNSDTA